MTNSIKAKLDNRKIKTIIDKHRGAKLFILIRNLNQIFELLNLEYLISTTCQYLNLTISQLFEVDFEVLCGFTT